jgi:hypothetical protein
MNRDAIIFVIWATYIVGFYWLWIMCYKFPPDGLEYKHLTPFITALLWPVLFVVMIIYLIRIYVFGQNKPPVK